jgi:hypothetical protein
LSLIFSFTATLILMGAVFILLHLVIVWAGVSDLVALLVFALPIVVYISYCTHEARKKVIASALRIYLSFAFVVVASAGLVYLIGQ